MNNCNKTRRTGGFTLLELVVFLALVAVAAFSILYPVEAVASLVLALSAAAAVYAVFLVCKGMAKGLRHFLKGGKGGRA
ncbi:MAG TPA: type II secretion system protein [Bacteroidia bacterium]|nr:type II secretion system protein [Bacteroidia bacterium]